MLLGSDVFPFPEGGPVYSQVPAVKLPRLHKIPEFSDMHSLENQLEVLQKHLFETPSDWVTVMSMVRLDFFVSHGLVSSPLQTNTSHNNNFIRFILTYPVDFFGGWFADTLQRN